MWKILNIVCWTEEFLDKELKYSEKVFHENGNYPKYVIKQIVKQSYVKHKEQGLDTTNMNVNLNDIVEERNTSEKKQHLLLVPYQNKKGHFVIKSMKKRMKALLPTNIKTKIAFKIVLVSCIVIAALFIFLLRFQSL